MTTDEAPAPGEGAADNSNRMPFDTSVANQARIYDYLLGGKDNYEADRTAVDDIAAVIAAGRGYGFEPVNPVQVVADGRLTGTKVFYTKGPDNLTIELMEPPIGRKSG
jgi:hypothetical protein